MQNKKDFEIISIIFNKAYTVNFPKDTIITLNTDYLILSTRKKDVNLEDINLEEFEHIDLSDLRDVEIYRRKKSNSSNITTSFFEAVSKDRVTGDGSVNISAIVGENGSGKSTLLQLFKQSVWTNQDGEKTIDVTLIYREGNMLKFTYSLQEFKSYLDNFYFLSTSVGVSVNKNILDNRLSNRNTETGRAKFFFDIIKMGKPKELVAQWLKQKNFKIELELDAGGKDYDQERFQDSLNISDDFRRFLLKNVDRIQYLFLDKLRGNCLGGDLSNLLVFIGQDEQRRYTFILSTHIPLILRCLEANDFNIILVNALNYTKNFAKLIGGNEKEYQRLINDIFKMELGFPLDKDDEYFTKKINKNRQEIDQIHSKLKKQLIKDIGNYLAIKNATYESIIVSLGKVFETKQLKFIDIKENQIDLLNEELEDFLISSFNSDLILFSDSSRVQFMNLSSGEQILLIRFSNILNSIYTSWKEGSNIIILIDEPDLHLHLNWQKAYISRLLQSLGREIILLGIHAHIIIATHSPFILSDISSRHCLVLRKDGGTKRLFPTFGANFFDIIEQGFFLDRTNGDFSHEIISYISRKIRILDTIGLLINQSNEKADEKKMTLIKGLFEEIGIISNDRQLVELYDSEYQKLNNLLKEIDDTFIKSNIKYYD